MSEFIGPERRIRELRWFIDDGQYDHKLDAADMPTDNYVLHEHMKPGPVTVEISLDGIPRTVFHPHRLLHGSEAEE